MMAQKKTLSKTFSQIKISVEILHGIDFLFPFLDIGPNLLYETIL